MPWLQTKPCEHTRSPASVYTTHILKDYKNIQQNVSSRAWGGCLLLSLWLSMFSYSNLWYSPQPRKTEKVSSRRCLLTGMVPTCSKSPWKSQEELWQLLHGTCLPRTHKAIWWTWWCSWHSWIHRSESRLKKGPPGQSQNWQRAHRFSCLRRSPRSVKKQGLCHYLDKPGTQTTHE